MKVLLIKNRIWFWGLILIALGAIICRVVAWKSLLAIWTIKGVPVSDAQTLDLWAVNILDGLGFRDRVGYQLYEAFRMPFFSVVLASIYAVFGYAYFPARLILTGLSVAVSLGIAGIGRILFNRKVGFLAGFVCAFYYPLVKYSTAFMTETLFIFLWVLGVYLFLRSLHERGKGFICGSGLALGLAGLTRVVVFAVIPIMILYLLTFRMAWRLKFQRLGLWLIILMLSFSPWVIRNFMIFHAFFPTESGGTRQLWTGANPQYSATAYSGGGWREILWMDSHASEIEQNQRVMKETKAFIRENPIRYLDRVLWRANSYLTLKPEGLPNRWNKVSTYLAAWLGYIGFVLAILRRPRSGFLISGLFLSLLIIHSVAGEAVRYRLPSEWLWLVGGAYTLFCLGQFFTHRLLDLDENRDAAYSNSLFDLRFVRWGMPMLLVLPFLILFIRIHFNRAALRTQELPKLQQSVEEVLRACGLKEQFEAQGSVLHDISYYKEFAQNQYKSMHEIQYPNDVIIYAGQLSHFMLRDSAEIDLFGFRVNKAGLYVGDASIGCQVDPNTSLMLPKVLKRVQGIVIGTIVGRGTLGEPLISVRDIIIDGHHLKS